jgi:hypothetical protein
VNRANLGLNDAILSGLKNGIGGTSMDKSFIMQPKTAKNRLFQRTMQFNAPGPK